jgi:hypothetical protein
MNPESRRKARLWLALVFVLGAATGGVFGYSFARRSYAATTVPPSPLSEPDRRAKRVAEMTKAVGLSPEQSEKVDAIIHQAHNNMKAIREKAESDSDAVRKQAREQVRQLLTADQLPKFEDMVQLHAEHKRQQQQQPAK